MKREEEREEGEGRGRGREGKGTKAGVKVQWLRVFADLREDPGSIPRTHMTGHNC